MLPAGTISARTDGTLYVTIGDQGGNWTLLWFILPAMGLIYVTRNTLFYASRMRSLRIAEDLCFDLRQRLFVHLQQLSLKRLYYRQGRSL